MSIEQDKRFMQVALSLAQRGIGRTADNPPVGCAIVRMGQIVGQGWTADGGRPHAETEALTSAGERAEGATAYVTLEPCSHYGKTPPCANALIAAGIRRVVIAAQDEDKRVSGKGIAMLREEGIEVVTGVLAEQAEQVHLGFMRRLREGLPFISVKIATSQDERITTGTAAPWLTGEKARAFGHLLRARHQAIVTGSGTVLADNPRLDCRLNGLEEASPLRVVLDRKLQTPADAAVLPAMILTSYCRYDSKEWHALTHAGADIHCLPEGFGFAEAMQFLTSRGITSVLVEGGQALTEAALVSGIANRCYWFKAPITIGQNGLSAVTARGGLSALLQGWELQSLRRFGNDILHSYISSYTYIRCSQA